MKAFNYILIFLSAVVLFSGRAHADVVPPGAVQTISVFGVCKEITNNHSSGLTVFVPTASDAEWGGFRTSLPPGVTMGECRCNLPWGGTIPHGASVAAYQAAGVACGGGCTGEMRTCNSGILSGSYTNQSCSVAVCAGCGLPWGGSIAHGASVRAYQDDHLDCGSDCERADNAENRVCNNGSLSGSMGHASCSAGPCDEDDGDGGGGDGGGGGGDSDKVCSNCCNCGAGDCAGGNCCDMYSDGSCR